MVLLAVVQVPNHVIFGLVVVDNNGLSVVLKIFLVCQFLVDGLCFAGELIDCFGDGHLSFGVGSVRPIVLIPQICHANIFIEKVAFLELVSISWLNLWLKYLFLKIHGRFFQAFLHFGQPFIDFICQVLFNLIFGFLVLFLFFIFLKIQPVGPIKISSVRFAYVVV